MTPPGDVGRASHHYRLDFEVRAAAPREGDIACRAMITTGSRLVRRDEAAHDAQRPKIRRRLRDGRARDFSAILIRAAMTLDAEQLHGACRHYA